LLIGFLCASANLTSTAFGDTTLYIQSSSVTMSTAGRYSRADFIFPTPTDPLNAYDHIQAVFNAPPGYAFQISQSALSCYICYGIPHEPQASPWPLEGSIFTVLPGSGGPITFLRGNPQPVWSLFGENIETCQQYGFDLIPTTFTSLALQWPGSTGKGGPHLAPFESACFISDNDYSPLNLTLIPIPEPSIAALALLGVCATAWRLRSRMHTRMKITS
jgi:hypothetical protein